MRKKPPKKRPTSVRLSDLDRGAPHKEMFLQPWFIPKEIYYQIRSLLPSVHLAKMRYYFEDFGCLRCGKNDVYYGSNGFCELCSGLIRGRVKRALQRRLKQAGVKSDLKTISIFTERMTEAQRLLADILPEIIRRG
jgi:hypothetical protein